MGLVYVLFSGRRDFGPGNIRAVGAQVPQGGEGPEGQLRQRRPTSGSRRGGKAHQTPTAQWDLGWGDTRQ